LVALFLFLKGMTGALAPFSYLVIYNRLSDFQVKDTLYKFWVLKVKLRDRSGSSNNANAVGGGNGLRGGRTFDQVSTLK